jgi:hypothetical protein
VASHFGRDPGVHPPAFSRGYRGAEWQNELLLDCEKRQGQVDLDALPTSGPIRKVHYTVPFTDNSYVLPRTITVASSLGERTV